MFGMSKKKISAANLGIGHYNDGIPGAFLSCIAIASVEVIGNILLADYKAETGGLILPWPIQAWSRV